jgi:hypothetical protein
MYLNSSSLEPDDPALLYTAAASSVELNNIIETYRDGLDCFGEEHMGIYYNEVSSLRLVSEALKVSCYLSHFLSTKDGLKYVLAEEGLLKNLVINTFIHSNEIIKTFNSCINIDPKHTEVTAFFQGIKSATATGDVFNWPKVEALLGYVTEGTSRLSNHPLSLDEFEKSQQKLIQ